VDVIGELRASYDRLTQSQKRIAEYIVEHPESVAFSTVDQMATELGINPSTIVRFTYRLGLNGFPDLQDRIRQRVRSQLSRNERSAGGSGTLSHLADTSFAGSVEQEIRNLNRTIDGLILQDLEKAVDIIARARTVYVTAGLSSFALAHFFSLILERLRANTVLVSMEDGMSASRLAEIDGSDALVAFTFPPYAANTHKVALWARDNKAPVIAITDTPISAVAQIASIVLLAACAGPGLQNSLVAPMAVANALLNGLTVAKGTDALDRYGRLNNMLNRWDAFMLKGERPE
jgi:DNA-binding MurR/RpiR family transcriptional regulator